MNKERIHLVADLIEFEDAQPDTMKDNMRFSMSQFYETSDARSRSHGDVLMDYSGHYCDSVACIAGWAIVQARGKHALMDDNDPELTATALLGLSEKQADQLFWARNSIIEMEKITPAHAVRVLRDLARTGIVDWRGDKTRAALDTMASNPPIGG